MLLTKVLNKRLFIVLSAGLICSFAFYPSAKAQNMQLISTRGAGTVVGDDMALARDRALEDAMRRAVEEALGSMVENETIVNNYQVISDNIYSSSQGYIHSYTISDEKVEAGVYWVVIDAIVAMDDLEQDLEAISTILERVHRPRMVVLIDLDAPGWVGYGQGAMNPAEQLIAAAFTEKGFDVLDRAMMVATIEEKTGSTPVLPKLADKNKAAAAWALEKGAELITVGRAKVTKKTMPILGTMKSYQVSLTLSVIRTGNGEIIAGADAQEAVVHLDDTAGSKQALEKAGRAAAPSLIKQVSAKFLEETSEGSKIHLILHGINDRQLLEFKNTLESRVRGIQPGTLHQRYFAGGTAALDVRARGGAQALADELSAKNFDTFKVEMLNFSANKLEMNFIPKGSMPER